MNDPHFDYRSAKRFDTQRASGPFGVDELLPKKIATWVRKKHPATGKKQVLLNFVDWQRGQAARIISDFELYVYERTLTTVKHRESLDKQDKRDVAQSNFARDRNGRLLPHLRVVRALEFAPEEGEEAKHDENPALLQRLAMDEMVVDEGNDLVQEDRSSMDVILEMTHTKFSLLETLVRVYDHARSHFIFEICEEAVKRFLNARRIRFEDNEERMPFVQYRSLLLDRMQNSSVLDGLISYVLKPRENGCPLSLWTAERVAERRLLRDDGIGMSEETWLELVLAFMTAEEEQTLRVPARDARAENGDDAGYNTATLQAALAECDSENFKWFRQANCSDPVAVRIIALHKLTAPGEKSKRDKLEVNAIQKQKPKTAVAAGSSKTPSLPQKGGEPDHALFNSYPEKSLHRRVWDAIAAKKCIRCNGDHLRSACPKERQNWEEDFEKPDFWTRRAPAKQVRVQLDRTANVPCPSVLHVQCSSGICLIDTCSDVSLARRDVLRRNQSVEFPVVIAHLGGETSLSEAGFFLLDSERGHPEILPNVFAVSQMRLPAGVVVLLGVSDIRRLGLSLDYIAEHPGCYWESARPRPGFLSRMCQVFVRAFRDRRGYELALDDPSTPPLSVSPPLMNPEWEPAPAPPALAPASATRNQREEASPCPPSRPVPEYHRMPPLFLSELRAVNQAEQANRTAARIGRLVMGSSAEKKKRADARALASRSSSDAANSMPGAASTMVFAWDVR
jgi:hypothetical protein